MDGQSLPVLMDVAAVREGEARPYKPEEEGKDDYLGLIRVWGTWSPLISHAVGWDYCHTSTLPLLDYVKNKQIEWVYLLLGPELPCKKKLKSSLHPSLTLGRGWRAAGGRKGPHPATHKKKKENQLPDGGFLQIWLKQHDLNKKTTNFSSYKLSRLN